MSSQISSTPHRRPLSLSQSSVSNTPSRSFGQPLAAPPQQLSQSQASEDSFSAYLNHASGSSSPSSQPGKKLRRVGPYRSDEDDEPDSAWSSRRAFKSSTHLLSSQESESDIENAPLSASQDVASRSPSRAIRQPRPVLAPVLRREDDVVVVGRSLSSAVTSSAPTGASRAKDAEATPTNTQGSRATASSTAFRPSVAPTSSPIRRGAPMDLPPLYDGPSESQNHLSQSALEPYGLSSSGSRPTGADDMDASAPSGTQGTAEILGSSGTSVPRSFVVDDAHHIDLGEEGFDGEESDQLQDELEDSYSHRQQRDNLDDDVSDEGEDLDEDMRDGTDSKGLDSGVDANGMGENGRKRRRRTNQDEARVLASVFEQTAFPDLDTRTTLAQRLNMTVRSVSIWFQNRRQAMKKRSSRYGGPQGVAGLRPSEYPHTAAAVAAAVKLEDVVGSSSGFASSEDAKPPATSTDDVVPSLSSESSKAPEPLTSSTATSTVASVSAGASGTRAMRLPSPRPSPANQGGRIASIGGAVVAPEPAGPVKDLRDIVMGRTSLDGACGRVGLSRSVSLSSFDSISQRSFSRPPLSRKPSLNDVMQFQGERALSYMTSTPSPDEGPFSRPLSLSISMSGRAAIGGVSDEGADGERRCHKTTSLNASLASRLPPALATALRKQGLILGAQRSSQAAAEHDKPVERFVADVKPQTQSDSRPGAISHIWERMVSSSSSSDGPAAVEEETKRGSGPRGADADEEDEERTLRLIATRRAAKAQAKAKAELLSGKVLAAEAAAAAAASAAVSDSHTSRPLEKRIVQPSGRRFRLPTLDMAAGRDRACDASARAEKLSLRGCVTDALADDCDDVIDDDELGALLSRKRPRFGMDYDWGAITAQVQVRSEEQRARQALLAAAKVKARRAQNARAARRTLEAKRAHERMQQIEDEERERALALPALAALREQGATSSSQLSSPPPLPPPSPPAPERVQDHRRQHQHLFDEKGHIIAESLYESRDSYASSMRDGRFGGLPALPGLRSMLPIRTRSIPGSSSSGSSSLASSTAPLAMPGQRFSASSSRESGPPRLPPLMAVIDGASSSSPSLVRSGAPYRSLSHSTLPFEQPHSVSRDGARDAGRRAAPDSSHGGGSSSDDWGRPNSFARGGGGAPHPTSLRPRPHFNYSGLSPGPRGLQGAASAFRRTVSEAQPHQLRGRSTLSGPIVVGGGRGVLTVNRVSPPQQQTVARLPMSSSPATTKVSLRGGSGSGGGGGGHDDSGFFGSDSDEGEAGDENSVKAVAAAAQKDRRRQDAAAAAALTSSPAQGTRRGSAPRRAASQSPTKGHPDRQAAELLLGLGREN